ncbi:DUF3943 domain-containing protein [Stigmatella sp. ncwal1]|uniref:DUF3943 domain-containing protein n=1 Tax=Stigmatella ashevillensis TaxID=2995309 RepID=A0ABT5DI74_9BACT|nr:DUF3943 domain-containing protein [Stigmatella ashevillena]MDC0712794.1 DUF3943 domain-containing protein [Stigmatella ashevillena]
MMSGLLLAMALSSSLEPSPSPREAPAPAAVTVPDAPVRTWLVPAAHAAGLMAAMRTSLSLLWPRDFDPSRFRENFRQLRLSYSRPPLFDADQRALEWDGDRWLINTVGHGLFGAEVYARSRQCGHGPGPSLLATTLASTAWEYGVEAFHKQPSAQDLLWTPLVGALLGEGRFQLHRRVRDGGLTPGPTRTLLLFLLDPLGEAERRALGTRC